MPARAYADTRSQLIQTIQSGLSNLEWDDYQYPPVAHIGDLVRNRDSAYEAFTRPALFRVDPERAHNLTIGMAEMAGRTVGLSALIRATRRSPSAKLHTSLNGITFSSPIGLAAGFDKNARGVSLMSSLGFGHIEVGSVSGYPSEGNPSPRLFRLPADESVLVAYGVPNEGAARVAQRLHKAHWHAPLFINLVKTNDLRRPAVAPDVYEDFARSAGLLRPYADVFTLNLSCPNAAEDMDFFDRVDRIGELLRYLAESAPGTPLILKLKPNDDPHWLSEVVAVSHAFSDVAGFAVNLPAGGLSNLRLKGSYPHLVQQPGAVSGPPIREITSTVLRALRHATEPFGGRFSLVAAGGVSTGADAYAKIRLGASLVQIYTTLIYHGPGRIQKIIRELGDCLSHDGFDNVADAVGRDA